MRSIMVLCDFAERMVGAEVGGGGIKAENLLWGDWWRPRCRSGSQEDEVLQAGDLKGAVACPVAALCQRNGCH